MPLRVVFDTNVLLSLFAFPGDRWQPLRDAVADGRVCCLTRDDCFEEYRRIVASRAIDLDDDGRAGALARYAACATRVDELPCAAALPRCGDPDDQKFLELASVGAAHFLVTQDRALLAVAPRALPLRVVVPRRLREALTRG